MLTVMNKQSLPETDYQTRCIEAERKAQDFESAYFKAEERYSNLMDAYIKLQGYYLELLGAEKSPRNKIKEIDPFILVKMGRGMNVAQCK